MLNKRLDTHVTSFDTADNIDEKENIKKAIYEIGKSGRCIIHVTDVENGTDIIIDGSFKERKGYILETRTVGDHRWTKYRKSYFATWEDAYDQAVEYLTGAAMSIDKRLDQIAQAVINGRSELALYLAKRYIHTTKK